MGAKKYIISSYDDGTYDIPLVLRASVDDNGVLTIVEPDISSVKADVKKLSYCIICNQGEAIFTDSTTIDISRYLTKKKNLINIRVVLDLENTATEQKLQFIVDEALEIVVTTTIVDDLIMYYSSDFVVNPDPSLPVNLIEDILLSCNIENINMEAWETISSSFEDFLMIDSEFKGKADVSKTIDFTNKYVDNPIFMNTEITVLLARKPTFMKIKTVFEPIKMNYEISGDSVPSLNTVITLEDFVKFEQMLFKSILSNAFGILMTTNYPFKFASSAVLECVEISVREFIKDLDDLLLGNLDPLILYEV